MIKKYLRRISLVISIFFAFFLCPLFATQSKAEVIFITGYNMMDVAAIQTMLEENPTVFPHADPVNPLTWDFAEWDTSSPKKLVSLKFQDIVLTQPDLYLHTTNVQEIDGTRSNIAFRGLPYTLLSLSLNGNTSGYMPVFPALLKTLYINDLGLIALPALPASLELLSCNYNQIAALGSLPSGIKVVNCKGNNITSITTLPSNLETLQCDENPLETLVLPSTLKSLAASYTNITSLDLTNTNLSYLLLINCNNLATLELPLTTKSILIVSCPLIRTLDLSGMALTDYQIMMHLDSLTLPNNVNIAFPNTDTKDYDFSMVLNSSNNIIQLRTESGFKVLNWNPTPALSFVPGRTQDTWAEAYLPTQSTFISPAIIRGVHSDDCTQNIPSPIYVNGEFNITAAGSLENRTPEFSGQQRLVPKHIVLDGGTKFAFNFAGSAYTLPMTLSDTNAHTMDFVYSLQTWDGTNWAEESELNVGYYNNIRAVLPPTPTPNIPSRTAKPGAAPTPEHIGDPTQFSPTPTLQASPVQTLPPASTPTPTSEPVPIDKNTPEPATQTPASLIWIVVVVILLAALCLLIILLKKKRSAD